MVLLIKLIVWLVIGAFAGWLAGKAVKGSGFGLIGNIVVGIIGSIIGGFLFAMIGGLPVGGLVGSFITAFIGAVILIYVVRLLARR